MKVICYCGAKYALDATPEMVRHPVNFACPTCGADLSAQIQELAAHELGPACESVAGLAPATEIAPPPPAAPAGARPVVRVHRSVSGATAGAAPEDVKDLRFCSRHPRERVTDKCFVCGKPLCPQCMQLFGYVCSPHCREKGELQGIEIPVFAGQRDIAAGSRWRKAGWLAGSIAAVLLTVLGVWFWYAWFGSRPKAIVTLRFDADPAMAGMSAFCESQQMVFLHGDKLGRYDIAAKRQVWLRPLLDKKKLGAAAESEIRAMQEAVARGAAEGRIPSVQKLTKQLIRAGERALFLRVHGKNLWVSDGQRATRYDWESGEPRQEVAFSGDFSRAVLRGDHLEFREAAGTERLTVTRFSLIDGKVVTDEIHSYSAAAKLLPGAALGSGGSAGTPPGGRGRGMNAQQLGAAVANAPLPGRLASPATLSVARRQQEALDLMDTMDADAAPGRRGGSEAAAEPMMGPERAELIPTEGGFVQITAQLIEKNIVVRSAARPAPKKSALDGPVNATATMEVANELLNEISRNSGADLVREDQSKYRVKIHLGGRGAAVADWEGEVIGPPEIYPQSSVNVLVAGRRLIVLDQQNRQKWESTLNFPIAGQGTFLERDQAERQGLGPVVEQGDTLYVYDQGVLSAFALGSGIARWRLPSVGITGLFFDAEGMLYLNTTTASPEKIKYSRQIDVMDATAVVVLKLDPKDGRELWKHSLSGRVAYLSGKYIYTLSFTPPRDDEEEPDENLAVLGLQSQPYVRIRRISAKNGRVLWDYYEPRGALDVQIHDNRFQLVLKKEVEVLKFLSF